MDISKAVNATALSNPAEQGNKVGAGGAGAPDRRFADVLAHGNQGGPGGVQQPGATSPFSAPILDPGLSPSRAGGVGRTAGVGGMANVDRTRASVEMVGERSGVRPGQRGAPVDPSQNADWKQKLANDTSKAESKMDAMIEAARKGKAFSASELLAIQVEVFRYSQTVEVISRSTDKLVGAVKQTLGTQV
jgi:hypothetical protein